jgi:hypothetical protein
MARSSNERWFLFLLGLAVFATLAGLGWNKLQYGMNFIDEGMYMTDGWRLAVGDTVLPDSSASVVRMYVVFNALIFKLWPDISLLEFRQIQFFATMIAVLAMSVAVYRTTREYWYLPWAMSLFAFTGLDVVGMSSNMSYYTYPHLFITLHVATLLLGVTLTDKGLRYSIFILSGAFLWATGFSFMPLIAAGAAPLVIWGVFRATKSESEQTAFTLRDAIIVTVPVLVLWVGVLLYFGGGFVSALFDMRRYYAESSGGSASTISFTAFSYFATALILLVLYVQAARLPRPWALVGIGLVAAVAFMAVYTNLIGAIKPYWRGWFDAPMWFSGLLMAFAAIVLYRTCRNRLTGATLTETDRLILFMTLPSAVTGLAFVSQSGMGPLSLGYLSVPVVAALSLYFVDSAREDKGTPTYLAGGTLGSRFAVTARGVRLCALLFPIYYVVAWADWRFTYFDLSPKYLTHTIEDGFAKGIKTNAAYAAVVNWIQSQAAIHSAEGDTAIFYEQVPMGYMLTRRRPSLDHSWTGMALSKTLRKDAVEKMIRLEREPNIAFRFNRIPLYFPVSLKDETFSESGEYKWAPGDSVNDYVGREMTRVQKLSINGRGWLELFARK